MGLREEMKRQERGREDKRGEKREGKVHLAAKNREKGKFDQFLNFVAFQPHLRPL